MKLSKGGADSVRLRSFSISDEQISHARESGDTSITLVYQIKVQVTDLKGNKSGFSDREGRITFNIQTSNNPVPALTSLSPSSTKAGGPAFKLTVRGSNFISTSVVRWNGNNRATAFVSNTELVADITAIDIGTSGTANVTVFNPAPGGGLSNALTFTI